MSDHSGSNVSWTGSHWAMWLAGLGLAALLGGLVVYASRGFLDRSGQAQLDELAATRATSEAQIESLGTDLARAEERSRDFETAAMTLEAQNAELAAQLERATRVVQSLQTQVTSPPPTIVLNRTGRSGLPYCYFASDPGEFRLEFTSHPRVDAQLVESFFADPAVVRTWRAGTLYHMCYSDQGEISFVVYGEFEAEPEANNLIGIYSRERELITDLQFNRSSGDIGVCSLQGYIERNVVYACDGGDGPGGWNTVYVLDRNSGKSTVIKDCTYYLDETDCQINLLGLGR